MLVRERNINLLNEAVTYMATMETITCIITIEIVMCIMQCRKYIFDVDIFTGICVAETSNCIIATETVTLITATKRYTNISVAESTTNIIAIEHQNLHNCYRKYQLNSFNRNHHLQNWLQKLSVAEMVTVRDRFSYSKEIEWISKY